MRYTLKTALHRRALRHLHRHRAAPEHLDKTEGLLRIARLVESPMLRVNYDTGNAFLGGEDPYAGLQAVLPAAWCTSTPRTSASSTPKKRRAGDRHARGCACGDGVIDWARVIGILRDAGWSGVLSAECGARSGAAQPAAPGGFARITQLCSDNEALPRYRATRG